MYKDIDSLQNEVEYYKGLFNNLGKEKCASEDKSTASIHKLENQLIEQQNELMSMIREKDEIINQLSDSLKEYEIDNNNKNEDIRKLTLERNEEMLELEKSKCL